MNTDCGYTGCNHPQGECSSGGACTKPKLRYFPKQTPDIDLSVGDDEPVNRWRLALNTFNLWHRSGCGLRQSLRKAFKALGGKF